MMNVLCAIVVGNNHVTDACITQLKKEMHMQRYGFSRLA